MKYTERYETYRHVPVADAVKDTRAGRRQRYRVTTINWTCAEGNCEEVHRNTYIWTLANLIDFIQTLKGKMPDGSSYEIGEDVIGVEPISPKGGKA